MTFRAQVARWAAPAEPADLPLPRVDPGVLDLERLEVRVDAPAEVTKPELLARYEAVVRGRFPRSPRAVGEPAAAGDEVVLDVVTFHDDRVVPFGARRGLAERLTGEGPLGPLCAGLVGVKVGARARVPALVPFDAPQLALRGEIVTYHALLRAAAAVTFVDPETPEGWASLGFGAPLPEVMASLLDELRGERIAQAALSAREAALDVLLARCPVVVDPALVTEELGRRWWEAEGSALAAFAVSVEQQEQAFAAWSVLRPEVERRLAVALLAAAVARQDGVPLTRDDVGAWVEVLAGQIGASVEEVRRGLREDPASGLATLRAVHQAKAVDHLLRHLRVEVAGRGTDRTNGSPAG